MVKNIETKAHIVQGWACTSLTEIHLSKVSKLFDQCAALKYGRLYGKLITLVSHDAVRTPKAKSFARAVSFKLPKLRYYCVCVKRSQAQQQQAEVIHEERLNVNEDCVVRIWRLIEPF